MLIQIARPFLVDGVWFDAHHMTLGIKFRFHCRFNEPQGSMNVSTEICFWGVNTKSQNQALFIYSIYLSRTRVVERNACTHLLSSMVLSSAYKILSSRVQFSSRADC